MYAQSCFANMAVAMHLGFLPGLPEVAHTGSEAAHRKLAAYLQSQQRHPLR